MKNTRWTSDQFKDKKLIETQPGIFVPADRVTDGLKPKIAQEPLKRAENQKVKNASKIEAYGLTFASRLEKYLYDLLLAAGIEFQFQKEYELQEGFRFHGDWIRPIKIIVDFFLPLNNMVIDSKGWQLADGKIKYKMLKRHFYNQNRYNMPKIEMPRNKSECEALVNQLKYGTH